MKSYQAHRIVFYKALFFNLAFLATTLSVAQETYKVSKATVVVAGTSTMHDWEMKAENFSCTALFDVQDQAIVNVKSLTLSLPVQSLKSGKNGMDKNAYAALKTDTHKQISFTATSSKTGGGKITTTGNLTIAGVTKATDVESACTVNGDGSITCKTTKVFKMSEYNVEPPSFMFGSVKTGDEITLTFNLTFKK